MFSTFKKLTFLIDNKLKKKLILIYFITIIGTFLETLGIGVVLPILKIIVEGKDFLSEFSSNNLIINDILKYLQKKSYGELVIFLLASLTFIFFIKTSFFLFLIQKQTKFSHLVEYELANFFFSHYLHQDYSFHLKRNSSELLANITEEIPRNFGIYDITKMLGSYSLFEYPEVEFEDKYIVIEDTKNKRKVKYWVCDPELIVRPPEGKEIALPSEDVNFVLNSDALDFTIKQASVLSLPEIGIIGNGTDITISALDSQTNETSSEQIVGETDKNFKFVS